MLEVRHPGKQGFAMGFGDVDKCGDQGFEQFGDLSVVFEDIEAEIHCHLIVTAAGGV